jgi:hypothetical protein
LLPLTAVLISAAVARATNHIYAGRGLIAAVIAFYAISGLMQDRRDLSGLNSIGDRDRRIATYLKSHGADPELGSLVMTPDPAQFSETTGFPAIPVPNNGLKAIRQAISDLRPNEVLLNEAQAQEFSDDSSSQPNRSAIEQIPETDVFVLSVHWR